MAALDFDQLEYLQPFLEQLQDTFVLLDAAGVIRYASGQARQLLGHRALHGDSSKLLGVENFEQLCTPVLERQTDGARWREIQLKRRGEPPLDLAACSMAVLFPGQPNPGVLLVLRDISGEVGLHRKYKLLLQEQRDINRRLRQHIAQKLREHEDDIAQFTEILQLAPAIFSSFTGEAHAAIETAERLVKEPISEELLIMGFRAMHTLKGNARSLGLNLIGGRAHAVEDLLEKLRGSGRLLRGDDLDVFSELLQDLRRAVDRASALRERLGEFTAEQLTAATGDIDLYEALAALAGETAEIARAVPCHHPAHSAIARARATLDRVGRLPMKPLFDYLRLTAAQVAKTVQQSTPVVTTSGESAKVPLAVYNALIAALPHLVRNAVLHGIEAPEVRRAAGKPETGRFHWGVLESDTELRIFVRDDGRGIDLPRLLHDAQQRGQAVPDTEAAICDLIFLPGVSTAEHLSLDAGRGFGTTAAKAAVEAAGGTIAVRRLPEGGTEFALSFPCT